MTTVEEEGILFLVLMFHTCIIPELAVPIIRMSSVVRSAYDIIAEMRLHVNVDVATYDIIAEICLHVNVDVGLR